MGKPSIIGRVTRWLCTGLLASCVCACSRDTDDAHTWALHAAAGRRLALVDVAGEELRLFDVATPNGGLPSRGTELPPAPYAIWAREGESHDVLVATAGAPDDDDEPPALVASSPDGSARRHRIAAPYTALAQTEDGRYAVAHFDAGARDVVASAAQLAVIDLEQKHNGAHEVSFELDGQPWSALWLTPELQLDGRALHLAVASFERYLGLLALGRPGDGPRFVALTGDRGRPARVTQLVWLPSEGRLAWIAEGLDDLFVLTLRSSSDAGGYALDVAQFPAGSSPSALAVAELDAGRVLLVLGGAGRELRALDPGTGRGPLLELDDAASAIAACSPGCAHALLYTPGETSVVLVDAARAAAGERDALRAVRMPAKVRSVAIANHESRAICVLEGGQLAWVDLDAGTLHSVALGQAGASSMQLARDGSLWFAPAGQDLVTRLEPWSGARAEVQLEAPIARLVLVPDAERAVIIHNHVGLALSVIDAKAPARDSVLYVEDLP